jgi:hypothetical protein
LAAVAEKKPWRTEMTVVLVNEDSRQGWDETWPEKQVNKIKSNYEKVTWVLAKC